MIMARHGSRCPKLRARILDLGSQTQGREGELEMAPDFETSELALSDTLL